jgi:hypothetical protein
MRRNVRACGWSSGWPTTPALLRLCPSRLPSRAVATPNEAAPRNTSNASDAERWTGAGVSDSAPRHRRPGRLIMAWSRTAQTARWNHQRRMGQPTSEAPQATTTPGLRQTMRQMRITDAAMARTASRPQRRSDRLDRVLSQGMQSARRSQESSSDPALRQTNQTSTPLVKTRRSFW